MCAWDQLFVETRPGPYAGWHFCQSQMFWWTHGCQHIQIEKLCVFYYLKLTINTHVTPFTLILKSSLTVFMIFENCFCSFIFWPATDISTHPQWVFAHPNDGWTGLYQVMPVHQSPHDGWMVDGKNVKNKNHLPKKGLPKSHIVSYISKMGVTHVFE